MIIGRSTGLQDSGNSHFERVDSSQIKHGFRRGNQGVARFQAFFPRHFATDQAISQAGHLIALNDPKIPKPKVVEGRPDDAVLARRESRIKRNHGGQRIRAGRISLQLLNRRNLRLGKIEGIEDQFQGTPGSAQHQGRG